MNRLPPDDELPMLAALRAAAYQHSRHLDATPASTPHPPFITISRQAGAGGRTVATQLANRLNEIDPGDLPWTVFDNELIERVAADYQLRASTVAALEDQPPSWLEEALSSLTLATSASRPDELTVYHRVAATIRALADIGRVVIVGRGAGFIASDISGGVHLRLVALAEHRIAATAKAQNISSPAAADWVRQTDHHREAFYRRHWPHRPLIPENFTATFNVAAIRPDQLVNSIICLLALKSAAALRSSDRATQLSQSTSPRN
jgi:hypothetical protein